jgi:hypothetical protein
MVYIAMSNPTNIPSHMPSHIPSHIPYPSWAPGGPHDKNLVFSDKCYKHFNKGCPAGTDNQSVLDCGTCLANNAQEWSANYDSIHPTSNDKQIIKDCGEPLTANSLLSAGVYCVGAHPELDSNTPWWVWAIITFVVLIVLSFLLKAITGRATGGGNSNAGWYGGFADEPMREM